VKIGDRNARDVGDARDRQVDLGAEDHEGEADGDDARDRNLGSGCCRHWSSVANEGLATAKKPLRHMSVRNGADVAHLGAQHGPRTCAGRVRSAAETVTLSPVTIWSPSRASSRRSLLIASLLNSRTTVPRLRTMMRSASDRTVSGSVESTMMAKSPRAQDRG